MICCVYIIVVHYNIIMKTIFAVKICVLQHLLDYKKKRMQLMVCTFKTFIISGKAL